MSSPEAVVRASLQAYVDKDRAAIEAIIADDFHFTSPRDKRIDRRAYFARCWPASASFVGIDVVRIKADGPEVYVTYEARTNAAHNFRNTEYMVVRDGQLVEVEVYFGWDLPHPGTTI